MTKALPPSPATHHLLQFLHQELIVQQKSLLWLAERSGVSYNTLKKALQNKSNISLWSVEAALNALGYTTKITVLRRQ